MFLQIFVYVLPANALFPAEEPEGSEPQLELEESIGNIDEVL